MSGSISSGAPAVDPTTGILYNAATGAPLLSPTGLLQTEGGGSFGLSGNLGSAFGGGGIFSLLNPQTQTGGTGTGYGSGALASQASDNLSAFANGSLANNNAAGANDLSVLSTAFGQWAGFQNNIATTISNTLSGLAAKVAKPANNFFSTLFG
jgi:hypothetical protein